MLNRNEIRLCLDKRGEMYPDAHCELNHKNPFECESLSMWIDNDHHDPVIIKSALREAVISGKLNFRYIDRILFDWKRNGIKTIEQAKSHGRNVRQHQKQKSKVENVQKQALPFYNWLEN